MNPKQLFEHLIAKNDLSAEQMHDVIHSCMSGEFNDLHIAAFLALMRMKGETPEELTAAAKVMQGLAHSIDLGTKAIDIVGTGGDGRNTFNISTACSFVVAAAGIPVAKHGNRSVSSRSGSADLLESAGFALDLEDKAMQQCMQECGIAFLFAPHYHPAMQHARTARQQLGIRTLFNLLGPVVNPARVKRQVVGVFASTWQMPIAIVLANLGSERALVVHSQDGLDEISIAAATDVVEYANQEFTSWTLNPEEFGIELQALDPIIVESPAQSLELINRVLAGQPGPARDIVLLNAAAAIYCAENAMTFDSALHRAQTAIDSGKAAQCFEQLRLLTQSLHQDGKDE